MDGQGMLTWPDGAQYIGEFRVRLCATVRKAAACAQVPTCQMPRCPCPASPARLGLCTYAHQNDKMHGEGKKILKDGTVQKGTFQVRALPSALLHASIPLIMSDHHPLASFTLTLAPPDTCAGR